MSFAAVDYFAVFLAAMASFAVGAVWYGVLGKPWMRAARLTPEMTRPTPSLFVISFLGELVMALIFALLLGHFEAATFTDVLAAAFFLWLGFIATTLVVNTRYQGFGWDLPLIDGGHWLLVLLVQGAVLGAFR